METPSQEALLVIHFDLDEGQVVELCHPAIFSKEELASLAMLAFPDCEQLKSSSKLAFTFWAKSVCLLGFSLFVRNKEEKNQRGY